MAQNTTFNPSSVVEFDKTKLNYDSQGARGLMTAGQSGNIDLLLADDVLLTGAWFCVDGGNFGDSVSLQIMVPDGIGGEVMAIQFVTNWFVAPSMQDHFDVEYPAKLRAGMTIRMVYNSTGTTPVNVIVNYKLHKVLV